ncbi:LolA family protein [Oceanomicrobium pacificus]|uniref:Outer membrane lipoprotein carrier protein LolA n=1 Tax=Oceanomicrobium pacificus TaxID=2692916 RepID=A0A6B0TUA6_9RHOB|nr:outer membrane lipoprotein carrier protein LolA [Oceanomicrobium pacificus]MXU64822.1 outer membrane lipoprotein carrier protein LolA [Oceanomicrobium pacificus]
MNRRDLLALGALSPLLGLAWPAAAAPVNRTQLSNYLNSLQRAEGRFRQTNPDGSRSSGRFLLAKPGRIRFEYDGQPKALVVADGVSIGVIDAKSNTGAQRYPLRSSPLSVLLRNNVNLNSSALVRSFGSNDQRTRITLVDPSSREIGSITMLFRNDPLLLDGWIIRDKAGKETQISLTEVRIGGQIDMGLFNIDLAARNYQKG